MADRRAVEIPADSDLPEFEAFEERSGTTKYLKNQRAVANPNKSWANWYPAGPSDDPGESSLPLASAGLQGESLRPPRSHNEYRTPRATPAHLKAPTCSLMQLYQREQADALVARRPRPHHKDQQERLEIPRYLRGVPEQTPYSIHVVTQPGEPSRGYTFF